MIEHTINFWLADHPGYNIKYKNTYNPGLCNNQFILAMFASDNNGNLIPNNYIKTVEYDYYTSENKKHIPDIWDALEYLYNLIKPIENGPASIGKSLKYTKHFLVKI